MLIKISSPEQVGQIADRLSKVDWIDKSYIDLVNDNKKILDEYIRKNNYMYLVFEVYFDANLGFEPIIRFVAGTDIFDASDFISMSADDLSRILGVWK